MKKNKKITTLVHFILDQSGSMGQILDSTIGGFNEYVDTLKKSKNKTNFSLTLFNSLKTTTPYIDTPIKNVKKLNKETFVPDGMTPLYDSAVDSIEKLYEKIGDKDQANVVVIMTDGEENSSQNHTESCLKKIIEKLQAKGNWTFVYLGANQDAWGNAQKYGILRGNTMSWDSSDIGSFKAYRGLADATVAYASNVGAKGSTAGTKSFFSPLDNKEVK